MVHWGGIKGLKMDTVGAVNKVLVQFCPRSFSPKAEKKKKTSDKSKSGMVDESAALQKAEAYKL